MPIDKLTTGNRTTIGVRTTSYRQTTNVLRPIGQPNSDITNPKTSSGPWVQLSRLDMPLVNELVIPLKDKNRWNGSKPAFDGQFGKYVLDPEPARLIEAILGVDVPEPPRNDLATIFLTGIPGLNKPNGVVPSSQLRLNTAIEPSENPSRLGILGGDNAGFPNGRRPDRRRSRHRASGPRRGHTAHARIQPSRRTTRSAMASIPTTCHCGRPSRTWPTRRTTRTRSKERGFCGGEERASPPGLKTF